MTVLENKLKEMSDKELNALLKRTKGKKLFELARIIQNYKKRIDKKKNV